MRRSTLCASRWPAQRTRAPDTGVCAVALLLALAHTTGARARTARVEQVAGTSAYMSAGARDGMVAGASYDVLRGRRKLGACVVAQVSTHRVRCTMNGAAVGDVVVLPAAPAAPEQPAPASAVARPLPADVQSAQRVAVLAAPRVLVPHSAKDGARALVQRVRAAVSLRHRAFLVFDGRQTSFQKPSVAFALRVDLGLLPGLFASTAGRVEVDALSPADRRFWADAPAHLELTNLALGRRAADGWFAQAGRFLPAQLPGTTLVDGAQVGVGLLGGALAVSGYAGLLPDIGSLLPRADRVAAGAGLSAVVRPFADVVVEPGLHAGVVASLSGAPLRTMVDAASRFAVSSAVTGGVGARVGIGTQGAPAGRVELAFADVAAQATPAFTGTASWVYRDAPLADVDAISGAAAEPYAVAPMHHGFVAVDWRGLSVLRIGAAASTAMDPAVLATGAAVDAVRLSVGPTIGVPLWDGAADISATYAEDLFFRAGRMISTTGFAAVLPETWVGARASYGETTAFGSTERAVSGGLNVRAGFLQAFALDARAAAQQVLPDAKHTATPLGVGVELSLSARL